MAKIIKKLHELASKDKLRKNLQHIIIDKGNFVVTNAHVLLIQPLSLHDFTEDEIDLLEGYCIHKDTFKELLKYGNLTVDDFGVITAQKGESLVKFELKTTASLESRYPNYESVIPDYSDLAALEKISFNPTLLNSLASCMVQANISLEFVAHNKAINVVGLLYDLNDKSYKRVEGQRAVLMPTAKP